MGHKSAKISRVASMENVSRTQANDLNKIRSAQNVDEEHKIRIMKKNVQRKSKDAMGQRPSRGKREVDEDGPAEGRDDAEYQSEKE